MMKGIGLHLSTVPPRCLSGFPIYTAVFLPHVWVGSPQYKQYCRLHRRPIRLWRKGLAV